MITFAFKLTFYIKYNTLHNYAGKLWYRTSRFVSKYSTLLCLTVYVHNLFCYYCMHAKLKTSQIISSSEHSKKVPK